MPVEAGTPVQFFDTSSNNPTAWEWDFGDGLGNSTEQNPTYNYSSPGTYTVTLTIENDCGISSSQEPITVKQLSHSDLYLPFVGKD
jgi:PKD repeat protein